LYYIPNDEREVNRTLAQRESNDNEESITLAQLKVRMLWKEGRLNEENEAATVSGQISANDSVSYTERDHLYSACESKSSDIEISLNDRDFDLLMRPMKTAPSLI
jgi:hypothetical protein